MKKKKRLCAVAEFTQESSANPMVSVCIGTYNQKEYIDQCLNSILNQLVDFRVEILINDDASTDGTQELLLKYQNKYPNIIRVFLQKENQFQKEKKYSSVYRIHASRIRGKYVALCDSDDYYCDNLTLYRKVKLLEKHKNCNACYSRVRKLDNNNLQTISLMPKFHLSSGIIKPKKMINIFVKNYCFQTSSYFFRSNYFINFCDDYPLFAQQINVFDEPVVMYFGNLGNVYYINKVCSVYRKFSNNSWSNNSKAKNKSQAINSMKQRIDYLSEFDKYSNYLFHKSCEWGITHAQICILNSKGETKDILKEKKLARFYKKRYFKEYIRLKYFSKS